LFLLSLLFLFQAASSPIPLDSAVTTGKLENGLTYFVRKNAKPKDKVELRLVVRAGSILEEDTQVGLAHFVEHMAFNGTASFKQNELVAFLQSNGTEFGADVNAYTSFNETVYMLPLPKNTPKLVDKGLTILYEWASKISFQPLEIDKERGVVLEEWRSGRGAQERIFNKQLGVLLHQSRYAERLPIGTKENLESFSHAELKRFYADWYRPELMSVIATGDFDPKWMEKRIRAVFSRIPRSVTPVKVPAYNVPEHKETLVSVETDPEASATSISLTIKHPRRAATTEAGYRDQLVRSLLFRMMNARLRERAQESTPPFLFAFASYSDGISPDRDFFELQAMTADTAVVSGFRELLREVWRARRFGFTSAEVDRAKASMLRSFEKAFQERGNTESGRYANELVEFAVRGNPVPGISYEYALVRHMVPGIEQDEISACLAALLTAENRVILASGPRKEGVHLPSSNALLEILAQTEREPLQPWTEARVGTELLDSKPERGQIIRKKHFPRLGLHEWKLSNGVTVVLKPTTFKKDQILMSAYSPGGYSTVTDTNYYSALVASALVNNAGVGQFDRAALEKFLAGKAVSVRPSIGMYSEGFSGQCSPRDLETLFQLITLYATQPRSDDRAFQNLTSQFKTLLKDSERNPESRFQTEVIKKIYGTSRWVTGFSSATDVEKARADSALRIYRDRFADFSDFTFFFTGAFTPDSIQPFVTGYLGGLPSLQRGEFFQEKPDTIRSACIDTTWHFYTEPKAFVQHIWSGPMVFNPATRFELNALSSVLDIILINEIREKLSGVYGISASITLTKIPRNAYQAEIRFPCAPENAELISTRIHQILDDIKKRGPSEADLKKVKETNRQQIKAALETNGFWHQSITDYYVNGIDPSYILDWENRNNGLSATRLAELARLVFREETEKRLVLKPVTQ
jgi:zinc protease